MKTVFLFIWLEYHGSLETKQGDPLYGSYSGPSVCVRIFVRTSRWGGQLTDLAYNLSVMAHKIDIFWIVTSDNWPYVHKSSHIRNLVTLNFKITGFESGHIVKTLIHQDSRAHHNWAIFPRFDFITLGDGCLRSYFNPPDKGLILTLL